MKAAMLDDLRHRLAERWLPSVPRPDADLPPAREARRTLRLYLIKASRYDDEGRLFQFRRGVIPSNTLFVLAGLARDWAERHGDTDLQLVVWDELIDPVLDEATIRSIVGTADADRADLLIALAGVQTGEYPRARDLALQFRGHGATVAIGGFHVSSDPESRRFLLSVGITVVTGEAEHTLPRLLDDVLESRIRPAYAAEGELRARTGLGTIDVPSLEHAPLPAIEARYLQRFFNTSFATIDTSRGCPFVCSFCAVKNVMGRSVRARDPQRTVDWMAHAHDTHGIQTFLIVDDDLYRSPNWRAVLGGIAKLRKGGRSLSLFLQADVEAAVPSLPGTSGRPFVDLAAEAGCYQVFMGFESLEASNLATIRKRQNQSIRARRGDTGNVDSELRERYRKIVDVWHAAGVGVHCGYMLGLAGDRPGCGRRAARELSAIGIDIASFFAATPLPGTEDFQAAKEDGTLLSKDWNRYDTTHFVRRHPAMSRLELEREYCDAYRTFYGARRLAWSASTLHSVPGLHMSARIGMLAQQFYYGYASRRGWHPMLGGILRRRTAEIRRAIGDREAEALYLPHPPSDAAVA